jgi:uncharacterized CHY-type Zn-finger protein
MGAIVRMHMIQIQYGDYYKMTSCCVDCGNYINFHSEGITYDITEDSKGNIVYLCQDCLNKIQDDANIINDKQQEQEEIYVCGDCGLECNMDDRLKYCDPRCPACKDEINVIKENQ